MLNKDRYEIGFDAVAKDAVMPAAVAKNSQNQERDLIEVALKQAAAAILKGESIPEGIVPAGIYPADFNRSAHEVANEFRTYKSLFRERASADQEVALEAAYPKIHQAFTRILDEALKS